MGRDLEGKVVVLTGASSGIGREAALQLARQGCRLVLAARRAEDLEDTARRCRIEGAEVGGDALAVVTDVSREEDVERLVRSALDAFGRIDVWVNNAGVTLFALLEQATFEEHRRVIETNLFGAMMAARAVIPVFRAQGAGVMVNVGSVLSQVGQPFVPSYTISKFGLRGLSEVLRVELADEPAIQICTLLPYAVDTPHFQSGANQRGRRARAMPPVQSPEDVAAALIDLIERPRRELHVPRVARLGLAFHALLPQTAERLLLHALRRWHFDDVPQPRTEGNLRHPVEVGEAEVHGRRPPRLGLGRFAAWVALELVRMQIAALRRRVGGGARDRHAAGLPRAVAAGR